MGSRVARHRRALVAAVAVAGSVVSACGSSPAPVSTPTPTVATTSASRRPDVELTPLSRFETRPQVQVMRRWALLLELSVNRRDASLKALAPVATPNGIAVLRRAYADDLAHGYRWPGPQPFTPTKVTVSGRTASVRACLEMGGWSIDRHTGKRVRKRSIAAGMFTLVKQGDAWRIDDATSAAFSCAGVKVTEVP